MTFKFPTRHLITNNTLTIACNRCLLHRFSTQTSKPAERVPMPKPGKSTGDPTLDDAIRKWRQTNTPEDERFQKLYQKSEAGLVKSLMERKEDPMEEYSVKVTPAQLRQILQEEDEEEEEMSTRNRKTGEINGPKGPEPTRYGDWERRGRTFDF